MADDAKVTLGWTSGTVPLHTHACLYYSDEQTLKGTLSFLREGLDAPGELCVIFADSSRHEGLLDWLQEGYSGDVRQKLSDGKLAVIGGAPTREKLLAGIASELDAGLARGNHLIRFLGFIAWGSAGWPDEEELLEFESQVNAAVLAYPAVIICTYGVPRLNGPQLIHGGLGAHPVIFLDERVLTGSPLFREPRLDSPAGR